MATVGQYITIATDASCHAKLKLAAWACYIRTPKGVTKLAGAFKSSVPGSYQAETFAVANALVIANQIADLTKHKLVLYSDSKSVLKFGKTKAGNVKKRDVERSKIIEQQIMPYLSRAISWQLRHVPSHTGRRDLKRFYMNNWCDKAAKQAMRQAAESLGNAAA